MIETLKGCQNCFSCEKGVSPSITADVYAEAVAKGEVKPEWLTGVECENCVSCQNCFSAQGEGKGGCANCFSCEKCFTAQGQGQPTVGRGEMTTYFVFLTQECNLRCSYCYATKTPPTMTDETLGQVIKFIGYDEGKRLGPGRQVSVQFFGGEPMLQWEKMQTFVKALDAAAKAEAFKVQWGMTTNGTLLTEDKMWLLKQWGMKPLLSIDGREATHDLHRVTKGGKGSWKQIPIDLILKYFPNPEIRPTIMPDTVGDWYEDLMWFYSKGMFTIATEVAYEADWTDEAFKKARTLFNRLADLYVERKKKALPMWMKFIEDGRGFLGSTEQKGYVCGVGRGTMAIDANGKVHACQRYASFSDPATAIGDVWKGLEPAKLKETQSLKREDMFPDPASGLSCESCVARWRCRGGCNAMNFQVNADRRMITKNHCRFQIMWAEISLRALAATGELWQKTNAGGCQHKR